jgi:predicted phosphohydrolase
MKPNDEIIINKEYDNIQTSISKYFPNGYNKIVKIYEDNEIIFYYNPFSIEYINNNISWLWKQIEPETNIYGPVILCNYNKSLNQYDTLGSLNPKDIAQIFKY